MRYPHLNILTTSTLISLALSIGGVALSFLKTPFWWFGAALIAAGAAIGWQTWRERSVEAMESLRTARKIGPFQVSPASFLLEASYLGLIIAVSTYMMGSVALGDRPVSNDHTVHFVNAWRMHVKLLPHGQLLGWSHDWFAGYPLGYLYPIGTELWVNAVWLLGLGALSLSQAYALAFWLFFTLFGYAVYRFGRTVAGPHVGVIAALLALTDSGDFRFGGWFYTVFYGVWPQSLSLAFALLALCRVPALAQRRDLKDISGFGCWMGLALITHPTPLLFIPVIWFATAVAAVLAREIRVAAALLRVVAASVLACAVAAVWLVPFLATRKEIYPMGAWWSTSYEIGKDLLELRLLPGSLGFVLAFGLLSLGVVLRGRSFGLLFTALVAIAIPGLFNASLIDALHLPFISTVFYRVQYERMVTMMKPFWLVLAGYLIVSVLRSLKPIITKSSETAAPTANAAPWNAILRTGALALLLGFLVLPVTLSAARVFFTQYIDRTVLVESARPMRDQRRQLLYWLKKNLPQGGFYRVGVLSGDDHSLLDLATELDRPFYKRGFTPCANFIYKMKSEELPILIAVNLRYAITKNDLNTEHFELLKSFGEIKVFRFKQWDRAPYKIIAGSGRVKFERFSSEEMAFTAAPGAYGKLRLNVSYFSRWKAYRDGQRIPIGKVSLQEEPETTGFMTVPLAPGRYRVVFERAFVDRLALPLSIVGLILAGLLALADRRSCRLGWLTRTAAFATGWAERFSEPAWSGARARSLAALVLVALGAVIALSLWQPPMMGLQAAGMPAIKRVRFDFLESLYRAHANVEYPDTNRDCQRQKDRFMCPDKEGNISVENYVASEPIDIKGYKMYRCIRARPLENGTLSVIYPRVPAGHALVGYYAIAHSGRLLNMWLPTEFSISVGGNVAFSGTTEEDSHIYWFNIPVRARDAKPYRVPVSFSTKAPDVRQRHLCFYAQMVDF